MFQKNDNWTLKKNIKVSCFISRKENFVFNYKTSWCASDIVFGRLKWSQQQQITH